LSVKHLKAFLKNELSCIHRQSSCKVAPNNLDLIMSTNLSIQGSDGLWMHINTVVAGSM